MRPRLFAVLALAIASACGGAASTTSDAAVATDGGDVVVDVVQTWRGYLASDDAQDVVTGSVGAPYDLPPADPVRWGAAYFEHTRYECARDGRQSFLLLNPPGAAWSDPLDVFVYLHGGGIGAFDERGTYHPEELSQRDCRSMVDQEDPGQLLARWSGDVCSGEWPPTVGLASLVVADADARILIVSKCDQDAYAGIGSPDTGNPWNPDNRVDGLLATVAAVELAFEVGATDSSHAVVLAGASAGGVGVHHVARTLVQRGRPVAGIVSDGAVMSDAFDSVFAAAPAGCAFREQVAAPSDWRPRLGRYATSDEQPHLHLSANSTPVFLSWSPEDSTFCSPAGATAIFEDMVNAVQMVNPGGVSEAHRVCVDGDCNAHALIRWAAPTAENTEQCDGAACERIIEAMHTWVGARRSGG